LSGVLQCNAEIAVGLGLIGLQSDRLPKAADGLVVLPLVLQRDAEIAVKPSA